MNEAYPTTRLRRLRQNPAIRRLIREQHLTTDDFIYPLFIHHGQGIKKSIPSMPGQYQYSIDHLPEILHELQQVKVPGVMLFGIPAHKDAKGSDAFNDDGIIASATRSIKELAPELMVISDVCCCEYTDHGHCGIINKNTGQMDVDNDATLTLLAEQAVCHAKAGVDMVAPSGMMDGMVRTIRAALDKNGFQHIPILSYAVKYSSAFYGPFREAADFSLAFGNRDTYQMDMANGDQAYREAAQDIAEGADMLMVKPGIAYLDIIYRVKQAHPGVPMAAYQVSGEYAMIKAAAEKGWLDEKAIVLEKLIALKRAGTDFIISYYAKDVCQWLGETS